jgi:hypothetical protein
MGYMTDASDAYEVLAKTLVERVQVLSGIETSRIERNVRLPGCATDHQIDVLWDVEGPRQRFIFECRKYGRTIEQKHLLAFRGVVDDLQTEARPVRGIMVTPVGYQRGAKGVATTYGITVLELRPPTDSDLAGRVRRLSLTIAPRVPFVRDIQVEPVTGEVMDPIVADTTDIYIRESGVLHPLVDFMLSGALNDVTAEPTAPRDVVRRFDPPAELVVAKAEMGKIRAIKATVGERVLPLVQVDVGGQEHLAYLLRDALGGARAWFAADGRIHTTDD